MLNQYKESTKKAECADKKKYDNLTYTCRHLKPLILAALSRSSEVYKKRENKKRGKAFVDKEIVDYTNKTFTDQPTPYNPFQHPSNPN